MSVDEERAVVHVVDDDAGVRDSTVLFLVHAGWTVRAFESAETFLDECGPDAFGCLLLDLRMPGMSGLELQGVMLERGYDLPIVFLTGHADVRQTVIALKRGAYDFVEKPWDQATLLDRVGEAIESHRRARAQLRARSTLQRRRSTLTPREAEILELVLEGLSSKHVGRRLGISHRTVEVHRASLMRKLEVGSITELLTRLAAGSEDPPT